MDMGMAGWYILIIFTVQEDFCFIRNFMIVRFFVCARSCSVGV